MGRPPEPKIVSLIVGNGNVKGKYGSKEVSFPATTGILQSNIGSFDMVDVGDSHAIGYNEAVFVYGHNVARFTRTGTTSMSAGRADGITAKRLFIAGLCELLPATDQQPDVVITTVPIGWYSEPSQMNKFKMSMVGDHRIYKAGKEFTYSISPEAVKVLPEGLPTLINHIYDDNLKVTRPELMQNNVGVTQWGTYTTDLLMFTNQQPSPAYSFSVQHGLSEIWRSIREQVSQNYGLNLSLHEADEAVKCGHIMVGKDEIDITDIADIAKEQLAEMVAEEVNTLWDNGKRIQYMINSGGGAPQIADFFTPRYRNTVNDIFTTDIKESAFDEAQGLHKFARIKMR